MLISPTPFRSRCFGAGRAALLIVVLSVSSAPAAEKLREMSTDRPDSTESPFTVDAGHGQLEMDFAAVLRERQRGVRTTAWDVAPFNLRFGLTRSFEAGIFISPWQRVEETPRGGPRERVSGFGDTVLRTKWNFSGNDGGDFAVGLIADLKLPTAARRLGNGKVEGALTLPIAFELGAGWGGGAMTTIGAAYTGAGRHRAIWSNTATISRDITEDLGGFLELTSETGDGPHIATFNCGLTRACGPNLQLDCGVNVGLSRSAPDLLFFAGLSRRW